MNDRRRVRLFLDHKPPLVAFTVVSIACALMMVHVARSEAAPGWLRAGLSGVVAQRIAEATVLEPNPAPERTTEAAGPLADGPRDPGTAPSGNAPGPSASQHPSPGTASPEAGSVEVGVVTTGGNDHAGSTRDDEPETSGDAAVVDGGTTGPDHGHRGPQAVSDVPVPGAFPGRGPRSSHGPHDWRDDWVGDRGHDDDHGRGHDGDRGHGPRSSTPPSHGPGHGPGEHAHGEHGHDHGGPGHGDGGRDRGEHGQYGHGWHGHGWHGHSGGKHGSVRGYTHH